MDEKTIYETTLSTIITLMEDLTPSKINSYFEIKELEDNKQKVSFTLTSKKSAEFYFSFWGFGMIDKTNFEKLVLISNKFGIVIKTDKTADIEIKLTITNKSSFYESVDSKILESFWDKIYFMMINTRSFEYIEFDYLQIYKYGTVENYLNKKLEEKLFESVSSNEELWVDYDEDGFYEEYICTYAEQVAIVCTNAIEIETIIDTYNPTSIELSVGEHLKIVSYEISDVWGLESQLRNAKKKVIDFTNQLVMSDEIDVHVESSCSCVYKQHSLVKINAQVPIVVERNLTYQEMFVLYCTECDVYYASKAEMLKLKKIGRIACQVMDYKDYHHSIFHGHNNQLQERSPLHLYGYNVNQKENLSSKERREILYMIIDHNILSLDETISYIEYFINKNGQKERNHLALEKWIDDLNFLKRFDVLDTNKRVRSITEY